ncbi:MAG TPA: Calx-beta domain-containing protein, partial [Pyrinomonadaceae bacterium]|nr:Calx-beta domain-containing protein [Pyrinomonadaceae bacterium]
DSNNNTIGPANLISGNSFSGISLKGAAATANLLQGNLVGTNAAGTGAIGNNLNGIELIDAQGNTIGGSTVVADNTIAFNAQDGIEIIDGNGNLIGPNSIFSNAMLGIDLSPNGVTPNDQGDSDKGANNLQNFPVLTSVVNSDGNTVVQGTLNSTPKTTFNIQVFSNASCDSSGNGEGQTIRGSTSVTTNLSGNATINLTIPTLIAAQFTATATDPNNNTSEFSACRLSTPESFLQFSSANFSGSEAAASTAITVTRSGGSSGAASVQFSIAGGGSATGGTSCTQGVDYVNTSGTLQWADGETGNKTFPITICNDVTFEGNETVNLALANSVGATLGAQSTAVFTLNDNDSQPTISINDLTRSEGNFGTTTFAFAVSLSNPSSQTVTANYATADGTANAIGDYQPISPATLTFSPGITSQPINVLVIDDTLNESN